MNRNEHSSHARRWASLIALLVTTPVWVGCNFDVVNPGPILDERLKDPRAQEALVNGAGRALSFALGYVSYTGAVAALELQGSGNITTMGVTLKQRAGDLAPEQAETNEHWQYAHTARWVAEESVKRMTEAIGEEFDSSPMAAQALIYVGFANRLLGENMCVAVIDGGAAQPRTVHFERAVAAFTRAVDIANRADEPDLALAARAGRAAANVWLGDWSAVASDAEAVPEGFIYSLGYSDIEIDQYNRIFWAGANSPFRAATVAGTYFDSYFTATGDPRTPWTTLEGYPTGDGSTIIFHRQMKYTSRDAPVRLASGREMQTLLAESRLRAGDTPGAVAILNHLRAGVGLPGVTAATPADGWELLRRERSAELWLEGRTLGDVYRWEAGSVPGAHYQDLAGRDRCFPVGQSEIDTNPEISGENG